jgi:hypothetical protein
VHRTLLGRLLWLNALFAAFGAVLVFSGLWGAVDLAQVGVGVLLMAGGGWVGYGIYRDLHGPGGRRR